MDEDNERAVRPPEKHPVKKGLRDLAEAAAQAVPVVGPLFGMASALGKSTLPNSEEKDRERWEGEVTHRVNEHDRAIRGERTEEISGTTAALARWLVTTSTDGLHEPHVDLDAIGEALGDAHSRQDIEEGAAELESFGLIELSQYFGGAILQPRWQLFAAVDPHVKGWNPRDDARTLAALALEMGEAFQSSELEAQSGFERRRFNPALSVLLDRVDPADVGDILQPDYAAPYAYLSSGTRVRLRRFIKGE